MGRVSTAPDRDSGLHLPVQPTSGAYPYLGLGNITHEANRDGCFGQCRIHPTTKVMGFLLDYV
jgi:hypothetical protein